ncbi:MAG: STT3 domain-containing protein, partial [Thermoplasmata archaeon]
EAKAWFSEHWATLVLLIGIFVLAMFLRTYFGFSPATDPAFLVSGGSDSYYHKRIIDYVVESGKHLVYDPLLGYPIGLRAGRPPLYDWSVAVIGIAFSPLFGSVDVSVWYSFLFSTAVWGSLTIFPLFFLTKEAFGRKAGLVAAFLLAVMPAHIQRSPFSNADHDAYALFFAVTAFFFFLRALQLLEDRKWVARWRKIDSIREGMRDFFANNSRSILYSLMSAFSIAAIALAWKGFAYVIVIILVYFGFQLLVSRLRNKDPMGILICFTITVGMALLVAYPWYRNFGFVRTWFDAPFYLYMAAIALGVIFTLTRDHPWALVIPVVFIAFGVSFAVLAIINPAVAQSFVSGAGYFVRTKTYETIAEAQAPNFSQLALAFGAVSFYLSLAGLVYSFIQIPKRLEPFYLFLVIWSGASIFMSLSAARFIFNAAPAFAMTAGWALVIIVDKLDFKSIRKSYEERRANKLYAIRKSVKLRHIGGAAFIAGMILLPNVWYGLDAGMPYEEKRQYDKAIVDMTPEFLRPPGLREGRNFYLGAFGYSLPLKTRYWPAAWDWLTEQDSDVLPIKERPAFLSWWDYGFEAVNAGKHPTVADNFLNGYQLAGNFLMAQGENDGIALLIARLIEGDYLENLEEGRLSDQVRTVITSYGIDYAEVEDILKNPGSYVPIILADPDTYGPRDSRMDIQNAMYIALRVLFTSKLEADRMADFYHDIRKVTGKSIRYFAVDSRLFPFSSSQTGIFYAPAKLSDHRMIENMPIDFFELTAETDMGAFYPHEVPIGAKVNQVRIDYHDMFYRSMLYKAFVGFSGEDVGETNIGIPGLSEELKDYMPVQAWNLTHFRVAYKTAYYNPYPVEELSNHTEAWTALNFEDAIRYQEEINNGERTGVIDASPRSTLYNGVVILKYYDGAFVNGTVLIDGVFPLSGAWVTVYDELQTVHYLTKTDSNGHYSVLAPFGEITVKVSVGGLQALTLTGPTELGSATFNVTDDQAMRRNLDTNKDGIYDYLITKNFDVPGGSLKGTVYLDTNANNEY